MVMVHTRAVARRTRDIKEESRTKQNDLEDAPSDHLHVLISNLGEDKTGGCGLPESHRIARRAPSYLVIGNNTNTHSNTNINTNSNMYTSLFQTKTFFFKLHTTAFCSTDGAGTHESGC